MQPTFDIHKIVEHFGGNTDLLERLVKNGVRDLTIGAIEQWKTRESIPANRLAQLLHLAKTEGRPINLNNFIKGAKDHEPTPTGTRSKNA